MIIAVGIQFQNLKKYLFEDNEINKVLHFYSQTLQQLVLILYIKSRSETVILEVTNLFSWNLQVTNIYRKYLFSITRQKYLVFVQKYKFNQQELHSHNLLILSLFIYLFTFINDENKNFFSQANNREIRESNLIRKTFKKNYTIS